MKNQGWKSDFHLVAGSVAHSNRNGNHDIAAREKGGWAIAITGFSICFVLFLWPLFSGRGEPRWDANRQFYPSFVYMADAYAEGRFPLWDPYTNCGYPFHAEPQFSTLNPMAIATGFLFRDSGHGFIMYYLILWWVAGMGTIWTAKVLGTRPPGAFVAALTYAFSGFFVGHAEHTPYICVAAFLPWVFGMATKSVADSRWGYALLSGAALGLSSLGGYPVLVFFTGFALTIWLLLWFLPGTGTGDQGRTLMGQMKNILGTLCIVGAVAVLIWSPVLHAFFTEGMGYTERVEPLSPTLANYGDSLTLPALLSSIYPYATILWDWRMGADLSMTNCYIGALSIPLAVYWCLRSDNKKRWGFLLFVGLMFMTSLGGKAGVRVLLYYLLPPMRFIRFSAPFRLYWIFPMALAAGFGISRLICHPDEKNTALRIASGWLVAVIGAAALLLILFIIRSGNHGTIAEHFPGRLFLPAALSLPVFIMALSVYKGQGISTVSRIPLALMLLVIAGDMWGHVENNKTTIWGMETDSIRQAEATHKRDTVLQGEPGARRPPSSQTYPMNVQQVDKVPAVGGYVTMKSRGFDEILSRSAYVEVLMSPIRFWLSSGTERSSLSEEEVLEVLSDVGGGVPVPIFVSDARNVISGERAVPGSYGKVNIRFYAPERIEMDVEVPGMRKAVLASTERFAAGWRVRVDGATADVFRVNLYFRGIIIPPGKHAVTWEYSPSLWNPLVGLSMSTLLLSLAGGIYLSSRSEGAGQSHVGS